MRASREARIAAAEAARAAPQSTRDAGEILVSTMQDGDTIYQHLYRRFRAGIATDADVAAMGAWVDRTNRLAKTVLDARIEERRTQLAESDGLLVAGVIRRSLDRLRDEVLEALAGHHEAERLVVRMWEPTVAVVVPRELRAIAAGPPAAGGLDA
ncbi:hypothetical protein [Aeromicrobium sp.]|uniref:hypothetical protein n=1 Tax=Aeromicrobium sp. TaxID=1871063 RepID=UPI0030BB7B83